MNAVLDAGIAVVVVVVVPGKVVVVVVVPQLPISVQNCTASVGLLAIALIISLAKVSASNALSNFCKTVFKQSLLLTPELGRFGP
jgi:hypothetical protein